MWRVVDPVVAAARRRSHGGRLAGVGTGAWWAAPTDLKLAGVLVLGLAWCAHDPERAVRQRLRELSWDLSSAHDWTAESRRPSHTSLAAIRAEPSPTARCVDPAAAARWTATGDSQDSAA